MGWSIGYDDNWNRDIGYGVPALCDHPDCDEKIDRGLGYLCGGPEPFGEHGCNLHFCSKHLSIGDESYQCERCLNDKEPFTPKPDIKEWVEWTLRYTEPSKTDRLSAASIISSYAYLLGSGITTGEAISRLRIMRKEYQNQKPRPYGE